MTDQGEPISYGFDVKEYGVDLRLTFSPNQWFDVLYILFWPWLSFALVLPKFEVKVDLPKVISILDKEATMKICGKWVTHLNPVEEMWCGAWMTSDITHHTANWILLTSCTRKQITVILQPLFIFSYFLKRIKTILGNCVFWVGVSHGSGSAVTLIGGYQLPRCANYWQRHTVQSNWTVCHFFISPHSVSCHQL